MADRKVQIVMEMVELSMQEQKQVQGGAHVDYFLKVEGIDGDVTSASLAPADYVVWRKNDGTY